MVHKYILGFGLMLNSMGAGFIGASPSASKGIWTAFIGLGLIGLGSGLIIFLG